MTRQIPAERPLPDKQRVLERVLADTDEKPRRRTWLLPVAAAASIAVVAAGALTVPSLLKHNGSGVAPQSEVATTKPSASGQQGGKSVSIDQGKLTDAQATAFATECIKWVGAKDRPGQHFDDAPLDWPGAGAKVDKIMHATKIAGRTTGTTDWTVAVRSGDRTYACVGRMPTKDADGKVMRDYDFGTFSTKYPDGLGGTGDGLGIITDLSGRKPTKLSTSRWVVAPPEAATVQRRIVVKGKPTAWFTSEVTDGLGYVRARVEAKLVVGDKVQMETRLLDQDGKPVGASLTERYVAVKIDHGSHATISLQADGAKPR
jgi:hypothetical protein